MSKAFASFLLDNFLKHARLIVMVLNPILPITNRKMIFYFKVVGHIFAVFWILTTGRRYYDSLRRGLSPITGVEEQ